jgi:AcrR family transcriptional regulator
MPRSPEQFDALRRESQERLERAALTVFAQLGFQRATVRDVAREAGVSQGLLYHYFRTKDELLVAVFRRGTDDVAAALAAAPPAGTPREQFDAFVRTSFRLLDEHRDYWRLNHLVRHDATAVAALGDQLHVWTRGVAHALAALLTALGHEDAPARARLLFAAIDGVAQHYLLDPGGYPLPAVLDALLATFGSPPDASPDARPSPSRAGATRRVRR